MMPFKIVRPKKKVEGEDLPDDPEPRCGYFIFSTGPNDKFIQCCAKHDEMYGDKSHGMNQKQVDKAFYACMLRTSQTTYDKFKADMYYKIVRTFGWMFWIVIPLMLVGCGGSDSYEYDNECSSCFAQEDAFGNPGIVCTNSVPFGATCFGGLVQHSAG